MVSDLDEPRSDGTLTVIGVVLLFIITLSLAQTDGSALLL